MGSKHIEESKSTGKLEHNRKGNREKNEICLKGGRRRVRVKESSNIKKREIERKKEICLKERRRRVRVTESSNISKREIEG